MKNIIGVALLAQIGHLWTNYGFQLVQGSLFSLNSRSAPNRACSLRDGINYDLVVIGGGSGGMSAAKRAKQHGAEVLLVEANKIGGTCAQRGCIPKKMFWFASQLARTGSIANDYGFPVDTDYSKKLDFSVFQRKLSMLLDDVSRNLAKSLTDLNVDIREGWGKIVEANKNGFVKVEVQGNNGVDVYKARHVVLATGSQPVPLTCKNADLAETSNELLLWNKLPSKVAIVGSGYVATEFANILADLGCEIDMFVREDRLLGLMDKYMINELMNVMKQKGIKFNVKSHVKELRQSSGKFTVIECSGNEHTGYDKVINAIGRAPVVKNMGLEDIGITFIPTVHRDNYPAIWTNENCETSIEGIYAVGDVQNKGTLAPVAIQNGKRLADRLFSIGPHYRPKYEYIPTVLFSSPALGICGLSQEKAEEMYGRDKIYVHVTRSRPLMRAFSVPNAGNDFLVKIICLIDEIDAKGNVIHDRIIGIHILGDQVEEMVQGFALALNLGVTKDDFLNSLPVHPSVAEEVLNVFQRASIA